MSDAENAIERPSKRLKTADESQTFDGPTSNSTEVHASKCVSDQIAAKEAKVGITAFVTESRFVLKGIVKKRYADFLVNEILPSGKVLHLRSTVAESGTGEEATETNGVSTSAFVQSEEEAMKPEITGTSTAAKLDHNSPNGNDSTVKGFSKPSDDHAMSEEDKAKLVSNLNETAVTQLLDLYTSILRFPKRKPKDQPVVRTEFTTDRSLRAHIHQDIRRIFNSRIESSTTPEGILVLSAAPPQSNRTHRPKPNIMSWQERGGEHCHFTLYKENKDTMEAISLLARFLKMNPKELSFAGTKDRRAVTVQRLSARRVDAERLAALNKALRMAAVGDFEYSRHEIGLGDLEGNEFTVTLRDCDTEFGDSNKFNTQEKMEKLRSYLSASMKDLHERGFLNYFGLQRFGTFATRSDIVGLKLLKGDFEGACDAILEYSDSALAAHVDDTEALVNNYMGSVGREDAARAHAINQFRIKNTVKDALSIMPKRFSAESAIIRHLGKNKSDYLGAILSIQHGMRTLYVHAYQSLVWNRAVSHRWSLSGSRVVEGDLVLVREHLEKEGQKDPEIFDADGEVIVQAEGENRAKVADEVFERARHLSKAEVESGAYTIFDIVLPQPGYDVLYPANESGDFYRQFMGSEEGGGLYPNDMRRKQREFSLSGAYRKLMARVGKDWEVDVKTYVRDDEQFVETDFERIKREHGESKVTSTEDGREGGEPQIQKLAAVLKFQLGTSQYATMALRELSGGGVREYKPEFSGGR